MISVRLDTRTGDRRLQKLLRQINAWGGMHAEVEPTTVLYELSSVRKKKLLATVDERHEHETRRRVTSKGEVLLEEYRRGRDVSQARLEAYWRYVAYVYVERSAWTSARDGGWGKVKESTYRRKEREYTEASAHASASMAITGRRTSLLGRSMRRGVDVARRSGRPAWAPRHYGVRAPETSRRWYRIQTGKQSVGMRSDRAERARLVRVVRTR